MFAHITPFAGDPIFNLGEAFHRDPRSKKVNLTVGLYYDDAGRIPVLGSVQAAESRLAGIVRPRGYLPIEGLESYRHALQQLVFGADSHALRAGRVATIQSLGGTGALRMAADLLYATYPASEVWISDPAWDNHFAIFEGAGIRTHRYSYYDPLTHSVRFEHMLDEFSTLPAHSIVLLHACCHNPTGADLSPAQWETLIEVLRQRRLIPCLDLAYQGFGEGLDEDAYAVRAMARADLSFLVANSFSKNFSFYAERCGGLSVVCPSASEADLVLGQLIALVRRSYSNPPVHGAQVISDILNTPAWSSQWSDEVAAMRQRIRAMRELAHRQMHEKAPHYDAHYLLAQQGMFSYTDLSTSQIHALRAQHGVYILDSGRINIPGLNTNNIEIFTDALAAVVSAPVHQTRGKP